MRARGVGAAVAVIAILVGLSASASASRQASAAGSAKPTLVYVTGTEKSPTPNLWEAWSSGRRAKIGPGQGPLLSPDGAFLAATSDYGKPGALQLMPTAGGTVVRFFDPNKVNAVAVAWSADSRYVAVELTSTTTNAMAGAGLDVIDTQTMTVHKVASGTVYGASFAPAGSGKGDQLIYGLSTSNHYNGPVNLYLAVGAGAGVVRVTTNGRSLFPVWGRKGIVFDREHLRGRDAAPEYQLWVRRGSELRQLTHLKVPKLLDGLIPLAVSASGNRLIANFNGEDTSNAWRVQLSPKRISVIKVKGYHYPVQGASISRNGSRLLVVRGGFEAPPSAGTVESLGFFGMRAHKLARGAQPSWDQ